MHGRSLSQFAIIAYLTACLLLGLPRLAAAQLAAFTVSPTSVTAGSVATATVTLPAPAPAGGVTVQLASSDNYAAGVPGSILIPQGATSANFPVATSYVSSTVTVTLNAAYVHVYTTTLTITFGPAMTLGPTDDAYVNTGTLASTNFGSSTQMLVKKDQNGITSQGNRCTYLKFDLTQVPAAASIQTATLRLNSQQNANGGLMTVKCYQISDTTWTEGAITFNNAPGISSTFTSTGTFVTSQVMYAAQGAVAFDLTNFVQGHVGQVVTLQFISEDITGQSSLFASKEAGNGGPMLTLSLVPGIASVSVAGPVNGGNVGAAGIVTLTQPAPSGGATVSLTSSNPAAATVLASVVVAAGSTSASFTALSAMTVSTATSTTITAGYNSTSSTTGLSVLPNASSLPTLTGFTISPSSVAGGTAVTGTLTFNASSTTAASVLVSCSNSQAAAPAPSGSFPLLVNIPANTAIAPFTITTSTVNRPTTLNFLASYNGVSKPATLNLTASNLRLTNITNSYLDVVWDTNTSCPYLVKRLEGSPSGSVDFSASVASGTYTYRDSSGYTSGNTYCYQLFDNTNPMSPALLSQEVVRPYLANATDNQAVDSRIDPRRSQNILLDHPFGATTYRGGLFAGYAAPNDNSQIGRSLLKFPLTSFPIGGTFRAGNVNAYFTGATDQNGGKNAVSVTVGCQAITDDSWLGSTLVWTTSLASLGNTFSAAAAVNGLLFNYSLSSPIGWASWPLPDDILSTLQGDQVLSAVLASTNEGSDGWAYFAKKEYAGGAYTPSVSYAFDIPVLVNVTFDHTTIGYGTPYGYATATIVVNGLGPGDSVPVSIAISYPLLPGYAPQTITTHTSVTGLQRTFLVAPNESGYDEAITVTVTCNGMQAGGVIHYITPPPMGP